MGSIYRPQYRDRHGNYRESSIYWIQYFVGGKRERENTHSESYEDAKNLEAQRTKTDKLQRKNGVIIPWVFHRDGRPIKEFKRSWKTACKNAGLPGRIPHDFRRTAVRNLVRAGIPETVAMQMTGHKTRSVFDRYNIVDETDLFEAARKLETHNSQSFQPKTRKAKSNDSAK